MKRPLFVSSIFIIFSTFAVSASPEVAKQAELLAEDGKVDQAIGFVQESLESARTQYEEAEYYILLSRLYFLKGLIMDNRGARKDEVLKLFSEGENYANRAIRLDPYDYRAYFWRGSNAGKWGQTKGVFSALGRVDSMRDDFKKTVELNPDFSLAWFSLGQLYEQLPGGIVSFGNDDYAVSLSRKSIDVMREEISQTDEEGLRYNYYVGLARQLHTRNWDAGKRQRELPEKRKRYREASDVLEKHFYYEGTKIIDDVSDREEAKEILDWVIDELNAVPSKKDQQRLYLRLAEQTYDELF